MDTVLEKNETYIFDVGEQDTLRLGILNDVYNPHSQRALLSLGLHNKKCVVDMACGQGEMTCWLAKQCQPDGMVIGVDSSEAQLQLAKQLAQQKKIHNIHFIQKSILDLRKGDLPMEPDFIYCRWLLIHLAEEHIKPAMRNLYALLAQKGMIVHEEVMLEESDTEGLARSFKRYLKLFARLAEKIHINFNLGSALPQLVDEVGYQRPRLQLLQPTFTPLQHQFFQLDLESAIPSFERYQIATAEDIREVVEAMQEDIAHGFSLTMTNYFVSGVK